MTDSPSDQKSSDGAQTHPEAANAVLTWTTHPLKRKPWVSVAVSLFVFLIAVLVYAGTESRLFTLLSLIVLVASLSKFYFPTVYTLTETTISVKSTTHTLVRNWSQYRSCYPDKNGILLSPFVEPSRLENFRGLYLIFEGNRELVTTYVRSRLGTSNEAGDLGKDDRVGDTAS